MYFYTIYIALKLWHYRYEFTKTRFLWSIKYSVKHNIWFYILGKRSWGEKNAYLITAMSY